MAPARPGGRDPTPTPAPAGTGASALSSALVVARDEELAALARCLAAPPALAVVEVEAGVGKTRLVAELVASPAAAGRLVLVGQCHPLRDPFPLGPVVEALRGVGGRAGGLALSPLAGCLRPVLPELAVHLPPLPEAVGDPRMERHRLWRAAVELLGAVGPAALVIEDLHWADEATAEFVIFLAAQLPARVVVVVTWRAEDLPAVSPLPALVARVPDAVTKAHVALAPLDPVAVKVLVQSILASGDVSDEFVAYLHERTAGIPFAVEEVLRLLQDRRDLVRLQGRWARRTLDRLEVPAAIRESVLERLARLDAGPRAIARAAAVLGQPGEEELLGAVAALPAPRAARALVAALEAALLQEQPGGRYGFRHALAADAVYGAIPGPSRRSYHHRAAAVIERRGDPAAAAQLARHYKEAGQPRHWVRHARAAAVHAEALGDHAAAAAFLLDALTAPGLPGTTRGQLALDLSVAALNGLIHVDAIAAVTSVLEQELPARGLRGKLLSNLGALLHQAGDASGSHRAIAQAVPELRGEPNLQALAMSALASPWVVEGSLAEHLRWLDQADAVAIEDTGDDVGGSLQASRTAVLLAVGDPAGSAGPQEPPGPGATAWDRAEWVRACTNLAVNCSYLGRYRQAERWAEEGTRAAESPGRERLTGSLRATGLLLRWVAGDWAGLAEEAAALEMEALDIPSAAQAAVVLGVAQIARGEVAKAEERLTTAAASAARCGAIPTMAMACAGLSRIALGRGDPRAARATAMRALETVAAKGIWVWAAEVAPVAVAALADCGEVEEAAAWARRFDEGIKGRDAPAAAAASAHCSALVAEAEDGWPSASPRFQVAYEAWAALPRPYEAARVAERRGLGLAETDRQAGAAALLEALATSTIWALPGTRPVRARSCAGCTSACPIPSGADGAATTACSRPASARSSTWPPPALRARGSRSGSSCRLAPSTTTSSGPSESWVWRQPRAKLGKDLP